MLLAQPQQYHTQPFSSDMACIVTLESELTMSHHRQLLCHYHCHLHHLHQDPLAPSPTSDRTNRLLYPGQGPWKNVCFEHVDTARPPFSEVEVLVSYPGQTHTPPASASDLAKHTTPDATTTHTRHGTFAGETSM